MANVDDPAIREAIADVRNDSSETDWVAFGYAAPAVIKVYATGTTGHAGLMEICTTDALLFCLLRMIDGDQESRRVKFIGLTFVGDDVGGMQRGRVAAHKGSIFGICGQMNIEIQAENHSECDEEVLKKKLKVAGGADYDTGSNAQGYRSNAKSIRQTSLAAYQTREKFGNIEAVVYTTSALPATTPMDLAGRPTVASASEAQKNTKDTILDTEKHKGKPGVFKGPSPSSAKPTTTKPALAKKADLSNEAEARARSAAILAEVQAEQEAEEAARQAAEASAAAQETELESRANTGTGDNVDEAEAEPSGGGDDDEEERARERAEKRRARREAAAVKARQEVEELKQKLANPQDDVAPSAPVVSPTATAKPPPPAKKPEIEKKPEPKKADGKKAFLFDDSEEGDDDLFTKPAPASEHHAEAEEDLPPGPDSTVNYDNDVVSVSYAALKALLVQHELLVSDFNGTPEELAQVVVDATA